MHRKVLQEGFDFRREKRASTVVRTIVKDTDRHHAEFGDRVMVIPGVETASSQTGDLRFRRSPDLIPGDLVTSEGSPAGDLKRIERINARVHQSELPDVPIPNWGVVWKN